MTRRLMSAKRLCLSKPLALVSIATVLYGAIVVNSRYEAVRVVSLYHKDPGLKRCISEALPKDKKTLAICSRWSTRDGEFFHALVYDASDEVMKSPGSISASWKSVVRTSGPEGSLNFFWDQGYCARRVMGHLYIVDFDRDVLPVIALRGGRREANVC